MTPTVLIANRGAIARRILRAVRALGWRSVAVYSEADAQSPVVLEADAAHFLGPAAPAESYLDVEKILAAARRSRATMIHPGYGFLSENPAFCEACEKIGIRFVGPTADQMRLFGLKDTARQAAKQCGVPLLPGTELLPNADAASEAAARIGYPVMLKSTAGGGGIGMRICEDEASLRENFATVSRLGATNFRNGGVFLEKYVRRARHVEVQIFGDGAGHVRALGERDCSVQRRHQKVIEEAPAPDLPESIRRDLHACAVRLGESVRYRSAGTVEFLYDAEAQAFYFLEVNTRLQVEHGVTEEIFGVDLVQGMLRLAAGETDFLTAWPSTSRGVSMQARIYAEAPARDFQPSTGTITRAEFPLHLRVETWVETGTEVTPYYDPMLAKVIVTAPTRAEAIARLSRALDGLHLDGIETNQSYLQAILENPEFQDSAVCTNFLQTFTFHPALIEVLDGGIETLVVDWPGRVGYWDVGVPPSGPFDDQSLRLANHLLGNAEEDAGLEMTLRGPTLRFLRPAWCCLTGAEMGAQLDGASVERGRPFRVEAGQTLSVGTAHGPGLRGYLAIRGGIDVPPYLGSRTTFHLGKFGGHAGRALRLGDSLRFFPQVAAEKLPVLREQPPDSWSNEWTIAVSYGPQGAPDFFTQEDIDMFFATAWEVHYNSARTGVRLIGPKPQWARTDGGEAGLHPSNLHDNAYQVGSIDFTGDMPIILGPDGPSLGGFVCPATVLSCELWKVGQLRPGDRVRFHPVALADTATYFPPTEAPAKREPVAEPAPETGGHEVVIRRQGDTGVLVEFGPMALDLALRFRVQALYETLRKNRQRGLLEITPGIRSLQVRYDPRQIDHEHLRGLLRDSLASLPADHDLSVPTRVVRLPLSWDDPSTRLAIEKYMQSVRPDAPWCPSNLEFIRRINGLDSIEAVRQIVFSARYLVMGLGDVYLGAPVATPLDPRHRLVTTKYNPARTWTPENAVGIGGAYLCIYGMEGPGGYQFVGRTVPVWNRYHQTKSFRDGCPWLLRFFDQIQFYPVDQEELPQLREDFLTGRFEVQIDPGTFRFADYEEFLAAEADSITAFRQKQQTAFSEERERWKEAGQSEAAFEEPAPEPDTAQPPPGCVAVSSPGAGNLWKLLVQPGDPVEPQQTVAILESMKMEIPCRAPLRGKVHSLPAREGRPVAPGQALVYLET